MLTCVSRAREKRQQPQQQPEQMAGGLGRTSYNNPLGRVSYNRPSAEQLERASVHKVSDFKKA